MQAIAKELKSRNKPASWLYKQLGDSSQTYNNWKLRGLPESKAVAVADILGWDAGALLRGRVVRLHNENVDAPYCNVEASMGSGMTPPEYEEVLSQISLSRRWIKDNLVVSNPSNLALLTAYGDSMKPTFADGDVVIVDRGITEASMDAVFVLERDGELYVKRIQRRLDGSMRIISDNKEYESYDITRKELRAVRILGRVLCAWTAKRL